MKRPFGGKRKGLNVSSYYNRLTTARLRRKLIRMFEWPQEYDHGTANILLSVLRDRGIDYRTLRSRFPQRGW